MITDDQVARLVRDAGHASPTSLHVDLDAVEQRVVRDRTVARTTGLLSTVGVLLLVAVVWFDPQSTLVDRAASGATTTRWWIPSLALLVAVLLAIVVTAVASRRAARTELGSGARASVSAAWGVLGLLALGPVVSVTSTMTVNPQFFQGFRHWPAAAGVASVCVVLGWTAFAARRRALGRGRGAALTTIWLLASWGVASWLAAAIASVVGRNAKVGPIDPQSAYTLAGAIAVALVCAAVLRRRAGDERPFLRGAALSLAVATALPAYFIGSAAVLGTASWLPHRSTAIPIVVALLAISLRSARYSLPPRTDGGWATAALGIAAVAFGTAAAADFWSLVVRGLGATSSASTLVSMAWAMALTVAAGVCLAAVERRGGWAPRRETAPDGEPPTG